MPARGSAGPADEQGGQRRLQLAEPPEDARGEEGQPLLGGPGWRCSRCPRRSLGQPTGQLPTLRAPQQYYPQQPCAQSSSHHTSTPHGNPQQQYGYPQQHYGGYGYPQQQWHSWIQGLPHSFLPLLPVRLTLARPCLGAREWNLGGVGLAPSRTPRLTHACGLGKVEYGFMLTFEFCLGDPRVLRAGFFKTF